MPARPRKQIIRRDEVGYYHCYNRCVRRAFLCGVDPLTGHNYEHRKEWIRQRLIELTAAFAVEVSGFTAMDNHLHLVLRNRPDLVLAWSDEDVARRWWRLCPLRRDPQGEPAEPQDVELNIWLADPQKMNQLRERLSDISWFMKLLCEQVARKANREDQVRGKFWEARFRSFPLRDYLQLLDWTGRQLRSDKRGAIPSQLAPILQRLKIDLTRWPRTVADFPRLFRTAAGRAASLVREAQRTGRRWLHGVRGADQAFG